jgi:hypothetical protein
LDGRGSLGNFLLIALIIKIFTWQRVVDLRVFEEKEVPNASRGELEEES